MRSRLSLFRHQEDGLYLPPFLKRKFSIFNLGINDGVLNPFNLPDVSGVRDYDNKIAGGDHLLTMLANVKIIADYQLNLTPLAR